MTDPEIIQQLARWVAHLQIAMKQLADGEPVDDHVEFWMAFDDQDTPAHDVLYSLGILGEFIDEPH